MNLYEKPEPHEDDSDHDAPWVVVFIYKNGTKPMEWVGLVKTAFDAAQDARKKHERNGEIIVLQVHRTSFYD